jgi:hypothetical protein
LGDFTVYKFTLKMNPGVTLSMQYDWHAWYGIILSGYPRDFFHAQSRNEERSLLYRIENGAVVVVSTHKPTRDYDNVEIKGNVTVEEYRPNCSGIVNVEGVIACYTRPTESQERSNRTPFNSVFDYAAKAELFCRRLRAAGYVGKIKTVTSSYTFYYRSKKDSYPVANFQAQLETENEEEVKSLKSALCSGVGRNKSSGCGLLLVRGGNL